MKTITKITICCCIFCYFAGLWIIASRFGFVRLLSRYGFPDVFDRIQTDFPQMKYLYIALAVYTVLFLILSIFLCRYAQRTSKQQAQLQEEASVVVSFSERMNVLLSQYDRSAAKEATTKQKLQVLSRKVASLPPAVVRNAALKAETLQVIGCLQDMLSDNCPDESFSASIDNACDTIDSIKRRSVTIR